ncbi:hypothetical protein BHM03_00023559 [Ensete ventricosum]|nr:hypothetical protein BHM03_00023559 [Ensete ventricosum]
MIGSLLDSRSPAWSYWLMFLSIWIRPSLVDSSTMVEISSPFLALEEGSMSQERHQPTNLGEHLEETNITHHVLGIVGQAHFPPSLEGNAPSQTPSMYWRLFNDPRLSPLKDDAAQPTVTSEAFLSLTQQVQTLIGMIQSIIPLLPQARLFPQLALQIVQISIASSPTKSLPSASHIPTDSPSSTVGPTDA